MPSIDSNGGSAAASQAVIFSTIAVAAAVVAKTSFVLIDRLVGGGAAGQQQQQQQEQLHVADAVTAVLDHLSSRGRRDRRLGRHRRHRRRHRRGSSSSSRSSGGADDAAAAADGDDDDGKGARAGRRHRPRAANHSSPSSAFFSTSTSSLDSAPEDGAEAAAGGRAAAAAGGDTEDVVRGGAEEEEEDGKAEGHPLAAENTAAAHAPSKTSKDRRKTHHSRRRNAPRHRHRHHSSSSSSSSTSDATTTTTSSTSSGSTSDSSRSRSRRRRHHHSRRRHRRRRRGRLSTDTQDTSDAPPPYGSSPRRSTQAMPRRSTFFPASGTSVLVPISKSQDGAADAGGGWRQKACPDLNANAFAAVIPSGGAGTDDILTNPIGTPSTPQILSGIFNAKCAAGGGGGAGGRSVNVGNSNAPNGGSNSNVFNGDGIPHVNSEFFAPALFSGATAPPTFGSNNTNNNNNNNAYGDNVSLSSSYQQQPVGTEQRHSGVIQTGNLATYGVSNNANYNVFERSSLTLGTTIANLSAAMGNATAAGNSTTNNNYTSPPLYSKGMPHGAVYMQGAGQPYGASPPAAYYPGAPPPSQPSVGPGGSHHHHHHNNAALAGASGSHYMGSFPPNGSSSTGTYPYPAAAPRRSAAAAGGAGTATSTPLAVPPPPEMPIYRIVITGGPCSGKSTSMGFLKTELEKCGYAVYCVPEVATMLMLGGARLWMTPEEQEQEEETVKAIIEKQKIIQSYQEALMELESGLGGGLLDASASERLSPGGGVFNFSSTRHNQLEEDDRNSSGLQQQQQQQRQQSPSQHEGQHEQQQQQQQRVGVTSSNDSNAKPLPGEVFNSFDDLGEVDEEGDGAALGASKAKRAADEANKEAAAVAAATAAADAAPLSRTKITIQRVVLQLMMMLEDCFYELAAIRGKPAVLLFDRGTMDGSAYCTPREWAAILEATGYTEEELRDTRYDAVVHLVTAALGAEDFYTLENNATRHETAEEAVAQDMITRRVWRGHFLVYVVDNSTGFDLKLQRELSFIKNVIGVDQPPPPPSSPLEAGGAAADPAAEAAEVRRLAFGLTGARQLRGLTFRRSTPSRGREVSPGVWEDVRAAAGGESGAAAADARNNSGAGAVVEVGELAFGASHGQNAEEQQKRSNSEDDDESLQATGDSGMAAAVARASGRRRLTLPPPSDDGSDAGAPLVPVLELGAAAAAAASAAGQAGGADGDSSKSPSPVIDDDAAAATAAPGSAAPVAGAAPAIPATARGGATSRRHHEQQQRRASRTARGGSLVEGVQQYFSLRRLDADKIPPDAVRSDVTVVTLVPTRREYLSEIIIRHVRDAPGAHPVYLRRVEFADALPPVPDSTTATATASASAPLRRRNISTRPISHEAFVCLAAHFDATQPLVRKAVARFVYQDQHLSVVTFIKPDELRGVTRVVAAPDADPADLPPWMEVDPQSALLAGEAIM